MFLSGEGKGKAFERGMDAPLGHGTYLTFELEWDPLPSSLPLDPPSSSRHIPHVVWQGRRPRYEDALLTLSTLAPIITVLHVSSRRHDDFGKKACSRPSPKLTCSTRTDDISTSCPISLTHFSQSSNKNLYAIRCLKRKCSELCCVTWTWCWAMMMYGERGSGQSSPL